MAKKNHGKNSEPQPQPHDAGVSNEDAQAMIDSGEASIPPEAVIPQDLAGSSAEDPAEVPHEVEEVLGKQPEALSDKDPMADHPKFAKFKK